MQYYSVDSQDGDYTILENTETHKTHQVKTSKLPPFVSSGDILKKSGLKYEFDLKRTNEEKNLIKNFVRNFFVLN